MFLLQSTAQGLRGEYAQAVADYERLAWLDAGVATEADRETLRQALRVLGIAADVADVHASDVTERYRLEKELAAVEQKLDDLGRQIPIRQAEYDQSIRPGVMQLSASSEELGRSVAQLTAELTKTATHWGHLKKKKDDLFRERPHAFSTRPPIQPLMG